MKTVNTVVTPQIASDWLKSNTNNRPIRRTYVDTIKIALRRGEYVQTHQGIAFDDAGVLIDGQHRLTAISELRDGAFPMLVTWGVSSAAFKVTDGGLKRTASDALKEDQRTVEVARLIATICAKTRGGVTPTALIPYIEIIRDVHADLVGFCGASTKTWTAVSARTAAVVSVLRGVDFDYVKSIYRALAHADFAAMPPVAQALYRSHVNGVINAQARNDALARFMIVFDPKKSKITRIQISDSSFAMDIVRETFSDVIELQAVPDESEIPKKMTASNGAAKGISLANYRTNNR